MEAAVFEVHLIITGRLDVVSVHLQKTSTNVSTGTEINRADRCGADAAAGWLTKSTVFLLFVSASCPEIKASHFSLSAGASSGGQKQTQAHADVHVDHVLFSLRPRHVIAHCKSDFSEQSSGAVHTIAERTSTSETPTGAQQIKGSKDHH